jgi:hypothetical protein
MQATTVTRFTRDEALGKMNHKVRALTSFVSVPLGTVGQVVGIHETEPGHYDVVIEWHLPSRAKPLRDMFAKGPYEQLLSEDLTILLACAV